MEFINIKLHTHYSILEACVSIKEYIDKAKKNNQKVLGITDDALFGAMFFYNECIKNDIKPIIGIEIPINGISLNGKFTLSLIAKNYTGYKNLCKISTLSYEKDIYLDDLLFLLEDVFVLSGGLKSELINLILDNKKTEAKKILEILKEKIPNIYFEVPLFSLDENQKSDIYQIYKESDVKAILTNDVFYLKKEDAIVQKIFAAIKENRNLDTVNNYIKVSGVHFKNTSDILNEYPNDLLNEGLSNLNDLVNLCNLEIKKEKLELPNIDIPENLSEREYIELLINENIYKKYKENLEKAKKRVKYELDIVEKMGYIKYFLIVYDFIKYAKENDIYVGPGRGSAAGSIISYLLNITEIDPLKYGLIFERFLNPDRISMPDIDVDVEQERRLDLIEYIKNKYSKLNTSQLITYSTFKPALALKDVARTLKIQEKNIRYILDDANVKGLDNISYKDKDLINYAKKIENKIKNISTHAAGIIITKENMKENLPLIYNKYAKDYQIQYEAIILEQMGYLKIDILGLKNLNIIKSVTKRLNLDIDLYNLPYLKEAFELFDKGKTLGIFQCESKGITSLAKKLKIKSLEDIALLLALYRPGPLESGFVDTLITIKNQNKKINYLHSILEEILSETYGVIVYQEQVMKIARKVSNYSLAQADELRKAIGKKNLEILKRNREIFIENSIIDKKIAEKIYDLIENFGNYGFNKAHAISYANITYQTAYLKAKYPIEFYCSVLTSELKVEKKLVNAYKEMQERNIELLGPCVNESSFEYISQNGAIRMPLSSLKEISEKTAKEIFKEREKGKFKDIIDFAKRCSKLDKSSMESLILSGAFDCFNISRKEMFNKYPIFSKFIQEELKLENDQKGHIFGGLYKNNLSFEIPYKTKENEYSIYELMEKEKEYFKLNLRISQMIKEKLIYKLLKVNKDWSIGYIEDKKVISTKKNELMAKITIDLNGKNIEALCFPKLYYQKSFLLNKRNICLFNLKKLDEYKYVINDIKYFDDYENYSLNIKIENLSNFNKRDFFDILSRYKGDKKIKIFIKKDEKYELVDMKNKYKVNLNEKLVQELVDLIGQDNIRLVLE